MLILKLLKASLLLWLFCFKYQNDDEPYMPLGLFLDSFHVLQSFFEKLNNRRNRNPGWTPQFSSIQFSRSVLSYSLRPHGLQHARLPCPSPIPRAYSNSYPLTRWCHPTITFSIVPFSSCLQPFPASGSFQMSPFFISGGQSIGVSASALVLPMNIQDWFPLGWTGWISLHSKGLSRVFSNTTVQSISSLVLSFLYSLTLTSIHDHWKNHSVD